MADFLDKLGQMRSNVEKKAKVLGIKSSAMVEINKIKSELNGLMKTKEEIFTEIGKKIYYYKDLEEEANIQEELKALEELDQLIQDKQKMISQIDEEKDAKVQAIEDEVIRTEDLSDIDETNIVDIHETHISEEILQSDVDDTEDENDKKQE